MEAADRAERGPVEREPLPDERGQLIDALAHQLQNPLAVIVGNLELLLEDLVAGDPQARSLRAIERAAGRIQEMVTDLLALARVNDPDHPVHEVEVDLTSLVRDVADSVSAEAAAAELKVELELPAEPLTVIGDPGELEDLLANLLSNAIKYSDTGGSVNVVVQSVSEHATSYVELRVRDRGIGISEVERGRLFEAFFRSRSAEARRRPGTGLGLTVVDRVVRRHHGRIEVESELGEGTSFRVLLPAG